MYDWGDVAARTLRVYDAATSDPRPDGLLPRLRRCVHAGPWAGPLWCCVLVLLHWWWRLLEWWTPAKEIERAPDWPRPPGS
jgi:phosphatidylinositol glycan class A protein